jgi:hypothetical protein
VEVGAAARDAMLSMMLMQEAETRTNKSGSPRLISEREWAGKEQRTRYRTTVEDDRSTDSFAKKKTGM